jgi:hypothetical protein
MIVGYNTGNFDLFSVYSKAFGREIQPTRISTNFSRKIKVPKKSRGLSNKVYCQLIRKITPLLNFSKNFVIVILELSCFFLAPNEIFELTENCIN